jgi:hypothetical protein
VLAGHDSLGLMSRQAGNFNSSFALCRAQSPFARAAILKMAGPSRALCVMI